MLNTLRAAMHQFFAAIPQGALTNEAESDTLEPAFRRGYNAETKAANPYSIGTESARLWDAGRLDAWSAGQI